MREKGETQSEGIDLCTYYLDVLYVYIYISIYVYIYIIINIYIYIYILSTQQTPTLKTAHPFYVIS